MRILFFLFFCNLLFGCAETETEAEAEKQPTDTKIESRFKGLLAKYQDISIDTLKVFSSIQLEDEQYSFRGKQLDSSDVVLLPIVLSEQYASDHGFFACYKFDIDSESVALITRTPSMYEPSSVKLLVLDKKADSITDFVELAEIFGDAGDFAEKTTWLFKGERCNTRAFVWIFDRHSNSVDDPNDTTVQITNYYYLLDIAHSKVDTVNNNGAPLPGGFGYLLADYEH